MSPLLKRILCTTFVCTAAMAGPAPAAGGSVAGSLGADDRRGLQREVRLIIDLLQNFHYAERSFLDIDGSEIVQQFLDGIDPAGGALTQADVEFMTRRFGHSLKSVYLMKGDVQPAFEIYDFFVKRVGERFDWIDHRLSGAFDLNVDEVLPFEEKAKPPADRAAADHRWELRLKDEIIDEILDGRSQDAAIAEVRKHYERLRRHITSMDALVVRERFLETLVNLFDPHSGYFSADTSREFEVEMEGTIAGVGLNVRKEDGHCVVDDVRAGGPAETQGEILAGDRVISVEGPDGVPVPAASKRLRDLAGLLRGEPGTTVRLVVAPAETPDAAREITLTRAQVVLPEERARGNLVTVPDADGRHHTVGWIDLPTFYASGEDAKVSSATRDVREIIGAMQAKGMEALVIDLRKNPGGAMSEAVSMTGLFIPSGTVLVTRGLDGKITEMKTGPAPVLFGGPLVVLTSPESASASEIFSGALHYHRRALLVGGPATFGKGTAQSYIDLEKNPARGTGGPAWGTLRLTGEQFFFPDGSSVQRTGAVSDLVLPDLADVDTTRETDLPHAVNAESVSIPGAAPVHGDFSAVTDDLISSLRGTLNARKAALPEFDLAKQRRDLLAEWRAKKDRTLVLERRRQLSVDRDAKVKTLRRARWTLAESVAFPMEAVDTAEVQAAIKTEVAAMRPRLWPHGGGTPGRLFGQRYWFVDAQGRLGNVPLDGVPFRDFIADAATLSDAFHAASGLTLDPDALGDVLQELNLLEHKSDRAVRACFARRLTGQVADEAVIARGVDAVMRRAAELDGSWLSDRSVLDVSGRESIRLASDWLDRQQKLPAPSTSNPPAASTETTSSAP